MYYRSIEGVWVLEPAGIDLIGVRSVASILFADKHATRSLDPQYTLHQFHQARVKWLPSVYRATSDAGRIAVVGHVQLCLVSRQYQGNKM